MISEDEEQDIVEDDVELELVDENDRLDELEIEHWEQVFLHLVKVMPSQKRDKISSKKDKENQKDDYLNSNNKSLLLY